MTNLDNFFAKDDEERKNNQSIKDPSSSKEDGNIDDKTKQNQVPEKSNSPVKSQKSIESEADENQEVPSQITVEDQSTQKSSSHPTEPDSKLSPTGTQLKLQFVGDDLGISGSIPEFLDKYESFQNPAENFTRFYPRDYYNIIKDLLSHGISYESDISISGSWPDNLDPQPTYELYEFQQEAVDSWLDSGNGSIILPTGGGKSIVGIEIINQLKVPTLIVVPTIVLMEQWSEKLIEFLQISDQYIGYWGGGDQEIKPITVTTYDSAHLYVKQLRNMFGLLILDEAHHMSGSSYSIIVDGYLARYRLALSATLSTKDRAYDVLTNTGFGPIVYKKQPEDLVKEDVISDFELETITVKMNNPEKYQSKMQTLQSYIRNHNLRGNVFQQIVFRVNRDPAAEKALKAYKEAKQLAFAAEQKIKVLEDILTSHSDEKMLIFSDMVDFCEQLSREFLIPCITNRTGKEERQFILERFKSTPKAKLISSKILDEGIDIPDATIGVIVAGSGHPRQFVQRLGRILRIHPGKKRAKLYEVISEDSMEENVSKRRKSTV